MPIRLEGRRGAPVLFRSEGPCTDEELEAFHEALGTALGWARTRLGAAGLAMPDVSDLA